MFSVDDNDSDNIVDDIVPTPNKQGIFDDIVHLILEDISQDKLQTSCQPEPAKHLLLAVKHGKTFQVKWYIDISWLEYSMSKSRAFCFCCRHFPTHRTGMVWTRDGFCSWNNGEKPIA